jgi:hypothetical protein
MPIILDTWEAEIRRISIQGQPKQIVLETPSPKLICAKWTGGVAHAVECLLCKCQALSTNHSPTKKKKKEGGKEKKGTILLCIAAHHSMAPFNGILINPCPLLQKKKERKKKNEQVLVAHACNPT